MHWMALWCLKQHEKVYSAWYSERRNACIPSCPSAASGMVLHTIAATMLSVLGGP